MVRSHTVTVHVEWDLDRTIKPSVSKVVLERKISTALAGAGIKVENITVRGAMHKPRSVRQILRDPKSRARVAKLREQMKELDRMPETDA